MDRDNLCLDLCSMWRGQLCGGVHALFFLYLEHTAKDGWVSYAGGNEQRTRRQSGPLQFVLKNETFSKPYLSVKAVVEFSCFYEQHTIHT